MALTCANCGTAAHPANGLVLNGKQVLCHRACPDLCDCDEFPCHGCPIHGDERVQP